MFSRNLHLKSSFFSLRTIDFWWLSGSYEAKGRKTIKNGLKIKSSFNQAWGIYFKDLQSNYPSYSKVRVTYKNVISTYLTLLWWPPFCPSVKKVGTYWTWRTFLSEFVKPPALCSSSSFCDQAILPGIKLSAFSFNFIISIIWFDLHFVLSCSIETLIYFC